MADYNSIHTGSAIDAAITKVAGIEAGADVTDTANVTAAGALMDSELADIAAIKALNQGVATTDSPLFTNTEFAAIAATIAATAVDVFVYDTSKDSDGGAWRKRCQHTSWYNETLNTATRGSRREFPAVAVIVAEANKVTIYDGDDPTLPMWMVAQGPNTGFVDNNVSSVVANNGTLSISHANTNNLNLVSFVADRMEIFTDSQGFSTFSVGGVWAGNISQRQEVTGITFRSNYSSFVSGYHNGLISRTVNDVAMSVLPDAPIDPATGLPVPTIAVATNGGVSVITDSGAVYDSSKTTAASDATIDGVRLRVAFTDSDVLGYDLAPIAADGFTGDIYDPATTPALLGTTTSLAKDASGSTSGVTLLAENEATPANGLVAYTTSTYNTGWMNGDIKGAFLADTDDTDLVGSTPLTDDFSYADATAMVAGGWSVNSGSIGDANNWTVDGAGNATITSASTNLWIYKAPLTVGKTYTVSVVFSSISAGFFNLYSGAQINPAGITSAGTYTYTFVAESTEFRIFAGGGSTGAVSSVEVKLADADRSVNNKGLIVNGTVTRSPVATGAELVAYSGFSASNYLEQPYNSDLDFGTGDFCVMGWVKDSAYTSFKRVCSRQDSGATGFGTGTSFTIASDNSGKLELICGLSTTTIQKTTTTNSMPVNVFTHFAAVRESGQLKLYINGTLAAPLVANTYNLTNTSASLVVGNGRYDGALQSGVDALALWRISATAPTADQIKKIYEDEKVLFQQNAACTLYGASDAVTALAHDPDTGLLHVGTSAGRSVFQGLRRVSNTAVAVGTAISASNGLVVEE